MFAGLSALKAMGRREAARIATLVAAGACAIVAVLMGIAFLAIAFYLWLEQRIGAPLAALGTGAAAFLLAFVIVLAARLATSRRKPEPDAAQAEEAISGSLGRFLGQSVSLTVKRHGIAAALGAFFAGFAVGASPTLRKELLSLLKAWTKS